MAIRMHPTPTSALTQPPKLLESSLAQRCQPSNLLSAMQSTFPVASSMPERIHACVSSSRVGHGSKWQRSLLLQVRLLEAGRYQSVGRYALDPGEEPCSVTAESLRNAETGALEPYITVGTALNYGEDYPCSGRVLLFRVTRTSAPGQADPWQATLMHARCD